MDKYQVLFYLIFKSGFLLLGLKKKNLATME